MQRKTMGFDKALPLRHYLSSGIIISCCSAQVKRDLAQKTKEVGPCEYALLKTAPVVTRPRNITACR